MSRKQHPTVRKFFDFVRSENRRVGLLTKESLAQAFSVTPATIRNWCSGKSAPSEGMTQTILDFILLNSKLIPASVLQELNLATRVEDYAIAKAHEQSYVSVADIGHLFNDNLRAAKACLLKLAQQGKLESRLFNSKDGSKETWCIPTPCTLPHEQWLRTGEKLGVSSAILEELKAKFEQNSHPKKLSTGIQVFNVCRHPLDFKMPNGKIERIHPHKSITLRSDVSMDAHQYSDGDTARTVTIKRIRNMLIPEDVQFLEKIKRDYPTAIILGSVQVAEVHPYVYGVLPSEGENWKDMPYSQRTCRCNEFTSYYVQEGV